MPVFKCKMCGGKIDFEQGATVGVCDSCGTKQTLPRLDDDKRANLYDGAGHVKETVVVQSSVNAASLLKRAFMFLEDGDWREADEYCEKVLDFEPENAEAYLGKLMAETKARELSNLKNSKQPFSDNSNYQKALRFGDSALQKQLLICNAQVIERKNQEVYDMAIKATNLANSEAAFRAAAAIFQRISGFKDADTLYEQCIEKAEDCLMEVERKAEEKRIAKKKAAEKRKRRIIIALSFILAGIVFSTLLITVIIPDRIYNSATELYNAEEYAEASGKFSVIPFYKDSREKAEESCTKAQIQITAEQIKNAGSGNVSTGKTIKFGFYEQDKKTLNGKEEIEWLVLAVDGKKALLISKYALDCQRYHTSDTDITWETCSLRKWLNDTFMNEAFGEDHKKMIAVTNVTADKSLLFLTNPGKATKDKMFILSISEMERYFSTTESRRCAPTAYAIKQGVKKSRVFKVDGKGTCWWWLRTPGITQKNASYVTNSGIYSGYKLKEDNNGVRPVMWINLNS